VEGVTLAQQAKAAKGKREKGHCVGGLLLVRLASVGLHRASLSNLGTVRKSKQETHHGHDLRPLTGDDFGASSPKPNLFSAPFIYALSL